MSITYDKIDDMTQVIEDTLTQGHGDNWGKEWKKMDEGDARGSLISSSFTQDQVM